MSPMTGSGALRSPIFTFTSFGCLGSSLVLGGCGIILAPTRRAHKPRAADDFDVISGRMEELRREREQLAAEGEPQPAA